MDSHDLFRQLTKGTRFSRKRQADTNKILDRQVEPRLEIKTEILKSERSDEDENCEFQFIEGFSVSSMSAKKKKTKNNLNDPMKQERLEEEEIVKLRKDYKISVLGKNIPSPITSFEDLFSSYNISKQLMANLSACSYPKPTPVQMQSIPILLKGRPLMACAPTGSGKTIAFLTPIINDLQAPQKIGFRALILAPTRELAQQINRECIRLSEKTALKIHFISKPKKAEETVGPSCKKKFDILISTPNRVKYLLQQEPPLLDLKSVEWLIIDEADRLMEDGPNNFKEQLDGILAACTNPSKKLALFSATYTVPVAKWAIRNMKQLARVTIGEQNSATDLVNQELLFVGSESGKLMEIRNLTKTGLKPPVLIFVQSKDRAKQLFEELLYDGINVDVIHADRTQQQRDNCVRAFREGHIWVLICTELMSRGIDFKGVNLVINYDFPPSTISYIHRIGRTGRAGRLGRAITFFTQDDTKHLRRIAEIIKNSGGKVPEFMLTMKKASKSDKKRLANQAPKRDQISTKLNSHSNQNNKTNNEKNELDQQNDKKPISKKIQKKNVTKKVEKISKMKRQNKQIINNVNKKNRKL